VRSSPDSFGRAWPAALLVVATYSAIEAPLRAVQGYELDGVGLALDWVVTAFFAFDVGVRVWRPGTDPSTGNPVRRSEALLDLIAVVPCMLALPSAIDPLASVHRDLSWLVLLRLTKIIRMWRDGRVLTQTQLVHPTVLRLVRFVFWSAILTHWIACGWMWLRLPDGFSGRASPYVESVYWAVTTVATVGYGDVMPSDAGEMLYAMSVMIVGVGVYGFVIGNLAGLLVDRDASSAAFQKKMDEVRAFMREHAVPVELRHRIEAHYHYQWSRRNEQGTMNAVADLPDALRAEVALHLSRPILAKVPFLRDGDEQLLRELAVELHPVLVARGEWVFRKGALGREMFLIDRGAVEIVDEQGKVLTTLGEGDFFGEVALLEGGRRNAGARAGQACRLYALDKSAFDAALDANPALAAHVRDVASRRAR
jgi:hypothetical protein